jgi:hypothetical protein
MGSRKDRERVSGTESREPAPEPPPRSQSSAGYGIQQAIELMRSLPASLQTTDVVVQVIKRTLESAHIGLSAIVADATRKEEQIEARLRTLEHEIETRRLEIETRTSEIARLQTEFDDISRVKERLAPR